MRTRLVEIPFDLHRLAVALGGEVRGDQVLAPGPNHGKADRSLAVKIDGTAPDGFLVHSFANDDAIVCKKYVREKCGLPPFKANGGRRSSSEVAALLRSAVLSQQPEKPKGVLVATYNYTDKDNSLLYQVLRFEPKTFRQRRPDGNGGWIWKLEDRRVLYRLPELLQYPDAAVFVCEGEKDADRIASSRHCATTVASGKWTDECVRALAGRDVLILEDNDDAGRQKAQATATLLHGIAKSVRAVRLPGLPDHGDVSDWLDSGHSSEELVDVCFDTPLWEPTTATGTPEDACINNFDTTPLEQTDRAASIALHWHGDKDKTPKRSWLIEGLLPETGSGLASGQWGTFKTFVALDLAAAVMASGRFINQDHAVVRRGGVLYIAAEGASEIPIRLAAVLQTKCSDMTRAPFAWTDQCPRLLDRDSVATLTAIAQQAAERMKTEFGLPLALIVIDTVIAAAGFSKSGDENDAAIGQTIMRQLASLAQATGAFVLGIDHFGKAAETGTRGSSAKEGAADVVLALLGEKAITGAVTDTRLALRKSRAGASGQEFPFSVRVIDLGVDDSSRPTTSLVIDWLAGPSQGAPKAEGSGWSKSLRLLQRALMNVLVDHGSDQRPFPDGPIVRTVDVEVVRAEFYKSYAADGDAKQKQNTKRQAFNRAVRDAQERSLICVRENGDTTWIWLVQKEPAPEDRGGTA
jgi:hypothetical protein